MTSSTIKSRTRLPNKTMWALDDIISSQESSRDLMGQVVKWIEREREQAKHKLDKRRLADLGELSHYISQLALEVAEGERIAKDARQGQYREI